MSDVWCELRRWLAISPVSDVWCAVQTEAPGETTTERFAEKESDGYEVSPQSDVPVRCDTAQASPIVIQTLSLVDDAVHARQ